MLERVMVKETHASNLRNIAQKLRKIPSSSEYIAHSMSNIETIIDLFGSYDNLVRAAGFTPKTSRHAPLTSYELVIELQELAKKLGHTPTKKEWRSFYGHSFGTIKDHFGSWRNFVVAAKLSKGKLTVGGRRAIPKKDLIKDLQTVAKKLKKSPTIAEYEEHGKFSSGTMRKYFGSWKNAATVAGLKTNNPGKHFEPKRHYMEHNTVKKTLQLPPKEGRSNKYIPDHRIFEQFGKLWWELGRVPSRREFDECSYTCSSRTIINHFGDWDAFLEKFHRPPLKKPR